jgi:hypothetical protein
MWIRATKEIGCGWWSEVKRRGDAGRRDGESERGGGMQESGRTMEKTR